MCALTDGDSVPETGLRWADGPLRRDMDVAARSGAPDMETRPCESPDCWGDG